MNVFNVLSLIGGLSLFLFGMSLMGAALEKRAGDHLTTLLGKLTSSKLMGFLTGLLVTAVIQSSSATTVLVVGLVNSSVMTLRQAINVIMGANVGTTVTAWLLSLTGIESSNFFVQLLKPSSFTPVLALIGIVLYMTAKTGKRKDTGVILLGFSILMFGMEAMSGAVSGLRSNQAFSSILLMFSNPILGVLAGALLTAIIQSSSASVGILQALASTGQITYGAAIPIIMGQNIGTCVTALISSVGANKNARRAAMVHLSFNIVGTIVWLTVYCVLTAVFDLALITRPIDQFGIAVVHTVFNVLCTALLLPMSGLLEKLSMRLIPDKKSEPEHTEQLDDRLLDTPSLAVERCRKVTEQMARVSTRALQDALVSLEHYTTPLADGIREMEDQTDRYEDILGTYLVKLGARSMSSRDSTESAKLLHIIGDFERIGDHAVNLLESAEEMRAKNIRFTEQAQKELSTLTSAVNEITLLSMRAFENDDLTAAAKVEPLEQVVDTLKEQLRTRHILRLQRGECTLDVGFVWSDLLTNLERVADHCSNIAGCVIEMQHASLDLHEYLDNYRSDTPEFLADYKAFSQKYALVPSQG